MLWLSLFLACLSWRRSYAQTAKPSIAITPPTNNGTVPLWPNLPANATILQCYTGIYRTGDPPKLYRAANVTATSDSCVSYCSICSGSDHNATGCNIGQPYSFYAIKSKADVAAMSTNTSKYAQFISCTTNACNTPRPLGMCPDSLPSNASILQCYTGIQLNSDPMQPYRAAGLTAPTYACVSYCSVCTGEDSAETGCKVNQYYSFYAIKSETDIATMTMHPTQYIDLKQCTSKSCNKPSGAGVCNLPAPKPTAAPAAAGPVTPTSIAPLRCYTGVQTPNLAPAPYMPANSSAAADTCVAYCAVCTASIALPALCTPGKFYSFYAEFPKTQVQRMVQQPSVYFHLASCTSDKCNAPSVQGVCLPGPNVVISMTILGCTLATFNSNTTLYASVLTSAVVRVLSRLPLLTLAAGMVTVADFSVAQAPAAQAMASARLTAAAAESRLGLGLGLDAAPESRSLLPAALLVSFTATTDAQVTYYDWASQLQLVSSNGADGQSELVQDVREYATRLKAPGLLGVTGITVTCSSLMPLGPTAAPVQAAETGSALQLGLSDDAWVGVGLAFLLLLAGSLVAFRAWTASRKAKALAEQENSGGDDIPTPGRLVRGTGVGSGGIKSLSPVGRLGAAGGLGSAVGNEGQLDREESAL